MAEAGDFRSFALILPWDGAEGSGLRNTAPGNRLSVWRVLQHPLIFRSPVRRQACRGRGIHGSGGVLSRTPIKSRKRAVHPGRPVRTCQLCRRHNIVRNPVPKVRGMRLQRYVGVPEGRHRATLPLARPVRI
ncbi:MAG: hypothetical protein K2M07_01940 [Muribaculaceae bacterium]|nr:hypothetical protein [Muribaculaceae bacterium]